MKKVLLIFLVIICIGIVFWFAQKKNTPYNLTINNNVSNIMKIESTAFKNNGNIPKIYTCDGIGVNPPLTFSDIPENTKSLVLIMDDPDIPESAKQSYGIDVWDHWIIFNMSPGTKVIAENSIPKGVIGKGTRGINKYTPPCPPDREHRYFFKLYALDTILPLDANVTKQEILKAMQGHILDEAELIGLYERK